MAVANPAAAVVLGIVAWLAFVCFKPYRTCRWCKNAKRCRLKRRGLTQRELAVAAGMSLSAVKKIEQGTYGGIRVETLRKLAVAMGVPTTTLMPAAVHPEPGAPDGAMWEPVREAIIHPRRAGDCDLTQLRMPGFPACTAAGRGTP